jgi:hypothetical protein
VSVFLCGWECFSCTLCAFPPQVLLSQFEFKPIRSTIVGSSAPGMARDRELEAVTKVLQEVLTDAAPSDTAHFAVRLIDVPAACVPSSFPHPHTLAHPIARHLHSQRKSVVVPSLVPFFSRLMNALWWC